MTCLPRAMSDFDFSADPLVPLFWGNISHVIDTQFFPYLHGMIHSRMVSHLELYDSLNRAITEEPKKSSRLASYFEAHFEFQSPYQSPSPSPEPPSSHKPAPIKITSPIREKKGNTLIRTNKKGKVYPTMLFSSLN